MPICSATLAAKKFSDYFAGAPIVTVPGIRYPVQVIYDSIPPNVTPSNVPVCAKYVAEKVASIHRAEEDGGILVFLTGQVCSSTKYTVELTEKF